jgi:hypothetical protein
MKSSYADQINAARLLLSGLKNQGQRLAKRGLDGAFTAHFDSVLADAQTLDSEQEALKARLAEKTAALNAKLEEVAAAASEVKKLVKLDFPQPSWKEFGIADVR